MKDNVYTLCYAGVLGTVCALLLTAAASFTKPYREANADAEKKRNILNVLRVPYSPKISSKQLLEVFEASVTPEKYGELDIYRYAPAKEPGKATIAILFEGPGLWGPIKGFLALDPEIETIRGITFYEQEETPGLGGEIVSWGFRKNFVELPIRDETGKVGIIISSRGEPAPNKVDAITGATMTCDKVQAMLNEAIKIIVEEKQ